VLWTSKSFISLTHLWYFVHLHSFCSRYLQYIQPSTTSASTTASALISTYNRSRPSFQVSGYIFGTFISPSIVIIFKLSTRQRLQDAVLTDLGNYYRYQSCNILCRRPNTSTNLRTRWLLRCLRTHAYLCSTLNLPLADQRHFKLEKMEHLLSFHHPITKITSPTCNFRSRNSYWK